MTSPQSANEPVMAFRPPRDALVRNQPGDFELRDEASGPPTMVGHFAVFNQWTEINSTSKINTE